MLRNWSEVIPAGSPDAGALVSGTEFVGLLGSEILAATASGDHGSGLFVPWSVEPDKRYRPLVTALTGADLDLYEDGAGVGYGPFTATLSVYEDNLLVSDSITVTGAIGPASATVQVSAAATALLLATIGAQASAAIRPTVNVTAAATALLLATIGAQAATGVALPPLTESLIRTIPAGRKAPIHLQPLDAGEVDDLVFDFTAKVPAGDQVSSVTLTSEARVGTDAAAKPLLYGLAQIQGNKVLQRARGDLGVVGVTYLLRADATLASGKELVATAFLKVVRLA